MPSNLHWLTLFVTLTSGCILDLTGLTGGALDASTQCPTTLPGRPLVFVAAPAPGFCIDATEVTRGDYKAFLDSKAGSTAGQGPSCEAWNTSFTPKVWSTNSSEADLPVVQVDWCDAAAYCAWAGKHLCQTRGGAVLDAGMVNDPSRDQWYAACSHDGERVYPYGDTFQSEACVSDRGAAAAVGTAAGCEGGTPGLFDMSGNVREWTDACDDTSTGVAGAQDGCWARGGGYLDGQQTLLACRTPADGTEARNTQSDAIGFRCCGP